MKHRRKLLGKRSKLGARAFLAVALVVSALGQAVRMEAFMEDICLPRKPGDGALSWCVRPTCTKPPLPNRACPEQTLDFATITPGRSMVHMDSTYFIAQALGYRADVAYWIAAYNEVSDFTHYVPIDQCGVQAANETSIASGTTKQTNGMVVHWPKGIEEKVACTRSSRTSSTSLTRSG